MNELPEGRHQNGAFDLTKPRITKLTTRQLEILELFSRGLSSKQIAVRTGISEQTIKNHATDIFRVFGVTNRIEAINVAYRYGFLERPKEVCPWCEEFMRRLDDIRRMVDDAEKAYQEATKTNSEEAVEPEEG